MKFIDFFSGVGGFRCGFEQAGNSVTVPVVYEIAFQSALRRYVISDLTGFNTIFVSAKFQSALRRYVISDPNGMLEFE